MAALEEPCGGDELFAVGGNLVGTFEERDGLMDEEKDGARIRGIFEGLLGQWRFEREIPGRAVMSGEACFTLVDEGTAVYEEAGEVRLEDGQRLHAKQSYVYRRVEGGFAVLFRETGELFQEVVFGVGAGGELRGEARHLCRADEYVSRYAFGLDGGFEVRHRVIGPRKDYSIRTVYRRRVN